MPLHSMQTMTQRLRDAQSGFDALQSTQFRLIWFRDLIMPWEGTNNSDLAGLLELESIGEPWEAALSVATGLEATGLADKDALIC